MAKKHAWKPRPADAIDLATLRWYAVSIEKLAIETYVTDRGRFAELDRLLRSQLNALCRFAEGAGRGVSVTEACPDGWFLCKDGLCAPACDQVSPLAPRARKGRRG